MKSYSQMQTWTRKTSSAKTGLYPAVGPWRKGAADDVNALATSNPTVACIPSRAAPIPSMFIRIPFLKFFTTCARGGACNRNQWHDGIAMKKASLLWPTLHCTLWATSAFQYTCHWHIFYYSESFNQISLDWWYKDQCNHFASTSFKFDLYLCWIMCCCS